MIVHIVLCKPHQGLAEGETRELTEAIARLARVPGVQNFSWGRDFSGRGQGYHYAAVMHFATAEDLATYSRDALHLEIVDELNRFAEARLVIDYETGTSVSST